MNATLADSATPKLVLDAGTFKQLISAYGPDAVAELSRLFIAYNILSSLSRMYITVLRDGSAPVRPYINEGDRLVSYLFTIGVLNEAFDAFYELARNNKFHQQSVLKRSEAYKNALATLKALSDKESTESFYSRHISPTRNKAAFHLNQNKIKEMIEEISKKDAKLLPPFLVSYGPSLLDERLPLFDRLLFRLVAWKGASQEELNRVVKEAGEALNAFLSFVESLVKCLFISGRSQTRQVGPPTTITARSRNYHEENE